MAEVETVDYLIVGSGLTGATLGRLLKDAGEEVLILDRRNHIGGNVHDAKHESGIRVHTYGPHLFRTNSEGIWNFVNQYCEFYPYEHVVSTVVDDEYEAWPITEDYLERIVGKDWEPEFKGKPTNFEEGALKIMPREIYEKFVRDYTVKQWGVHPTELGANLAKRFDVRKKGDRHFSSQKYQGLPVNGYASLMQNLLHGIDVRTGIDYLQSRDSYVARKKLIFTGPIDEFYDYKFGALKYRGQKRKSTYLPECTQTQPNSQVNYPSLTDGDFVRRIEWKLMMQPAEQEAIKGTLLTEETPYTPETQDQCEYPFPDQANAALYQKYRQLADQDDSLLICGRLGEYRYYDMDHAIGRAFVLANRIAGLNVSYLDKEAADAIPS